MSGSGENNLTVHLSLTSAPSAARVTIQIAPDITAAQLMEVVATGSHIPLAKLKLIFRGRLIASSDKLVVSEYKIEDGSVVHCMGKPQAPSSSASTTSAPPAASAAAGASVSVASSAASTPVVVAAPAVSSGPSQGAVAEALRTLQGSNSVTTYSTALQTVTKMVNNILEHATEEKYRKIRRSNAAVQRKLTGLTGGHALLLALGFVIQNVENDEYYVVVASADAWTHLVSSKAQIASALSQAQQQSRVSAPSPILPSVAPSMPGMGMPGMGMPGMGGGMPPHIDAAAQAHAANLMSDPQAMRSLIQDPNIRRMMDATHPRALQAMDQVASNPQMMDQVTRMLQDPAAVARAQQMMQQQGMGMGMGGSPAAGTNQSPNPSQMMQQMQMFQRMQQQMQQGGTGAGTPAAGTTGSGGAPSQAPGSTQNNNNSANNTNNELEMTEEEMIAEAIARSMRES